MNIEVTSRTDNLPDALRRYAAERLSGVERFGEEFEKGEVILTQEHDDLDCELILHRHRGEPFVAHARAKDGRSAVDSATMKLERQFVKFKEKFSHKGKRQRA